MTVRTLKAAAVIGLPILVAAFAVPAFALDVTFTTTGTFGCGTEVAANGGTCSTAAFGGDPNAQMTIANSGNTFNVQAVGYTNTNVIAGDINSDDVNALTFNDTASNFTSTTTPPGSPVQTGGAQFTLTITQLAPPVTPNSGTLSGAFSGTITASNSGVNITFNNTVLVLGQVTYTLDSNVWGVPTPGIATIGMTTDTATVTPEPTFMMLTGFGFAGVAFVAYRRRRTV
jgi:hypothetical protein